MICYTNKSITLLYTKISSFRYCNIIIGIYLSCTKLTFTLNEIIHHIHICYNWFRKLNFLRSITSYCIRMFLPIFPTYLTYNKIISCFKSCLNGIILMIFSWTCNSFNLSFLNFHKKKPGLWFLISCCIFILSWVFLINCKEIVSLFLNNKFGFIELISIRLYVNKRILVS